MRALVLQKMSGGVVCCESEAFVICKLRANIVKKHFGLAEGFYGVSSVSNSSSNRQKVIGQCAWRDILLPRLVDPRDKKESNDGHAKRTPLGYGAPVQM